MAKDKKGKYLHSRIAYLQRAAQYFATQQQDFSGRVVASQKENENVPEAAASNRRLYDSTNEQSSREKTLPLDLAHGSAGGMAHYFNNHVTQVARKSQIRLQHDTKHTICKRCTNHLVEGQTCTKALVNPSKGRQKPHADVLIVECGYCAAQRRFPIGTKRQKKKAIRFTEAPQDNRPTGYADPG
jgi:ribonuclease P protein subunit RPR2